MTGGAQASITSLLSDGFGPIISHMKSGGKNKTVSKNGERVAYAPVFVMNYQPVNSSDITSGVKREKTLIYSLALAETGDAITKSVQSSIDVDRAVNISIGVLAALIAVAAVILLFIAFRVTTSMTEPILQLLDVIQNMNW